MDQLSKAWGEKQWERPKLVKESIIMKFVDILQSKQKIMTNNNSSSEIGTNYK